MATYSAGSASIAIRPDLRDFRKRVKAALKKIDEEFVVDVSPDMKSFAQQVKAGFAGVPNELEVDIRAKTSAFSAQVDAVTRDRTIDVDVDVDTKAAAAQVAALQTQVNGIGSSLAMVGMYSGAIGGIGALASGALPAVSSLVGGLASMSGSLLVLPGAMAATGAGLGAVLTGTMGLSDAFSEMNGDAEKFNEALNKLSPNAAAFVTSIKGVSSQWADMQNTVQDSLFTDLGDSVEKFTAVQLPGLTKGFSAVNAEVNDGLRATVSQFSTELAAADLSRVLDNTARSVDGLSLSAAPLSQIWMDLSTVGSDYLPGMSRELGLATQRWSEMVSSARESGQLNEIIDGGLQAVSQFSAGVSDAGGILVGVYQAADQVGAPLVSTLGTVLDLTNQWVNSTAGQDSLVTFFESTSGAVESLAPALGTVATTIVGDLIPGMAGFISSAAPGFTTFIDGLAGGLAGAPEALTSLGSGFGDLLEAVSPLAPVVGSAVDVLGATGDVLTAVSGPLEVVASLLGEHPNLVLAAAGAWAAFKYVPKVNEQVQKTITGVKDSTSPAITGVKNLGLSFNEAYGYARQANPELGKFGAAMTVVGGQGGVAAAGLDKAKGAAGGLVNALGGPWGIGLMAATGLIVGVADASNRASEAEQALAGQSSAVAEAQGELVAAVAGTTGALGNDGLVAAAELARAELISLVAVGEQMDGFLSDTGVHAWNFEGSGKEMLEEQQRRRDLGDANKQLEESASELGMTMDDVYAVIAEGGPQFDQLVEKLRGTGSAGEAAADALEGARQSVVATVDAARALDPTMKAASDAIGVLADKSSSAGDKLSALNSILQIMGLAPKDAERAMRDASEAIEEVADKAADLADQNGVLGDSLIGVGGKLDTTTVNGRALFDELDNLGSTLQNVAANGGDTEAKFAEMQPALQALADEFGLTKDQVLELGRSFGLVPETLDVLVSLEGADTSLQEIAAISTTLQNTPNGKQIEVESLTDEAKQRLQDIGVAVVDLPNGNIGISVDDASAISRLQSVGIATETLPDGHVAISDTTDSNLARIAALGIEVATDKHGNVIIADNAMSVAASVRQTLDGLVTRGTHYQTYVQEVQYANTAGGTQPLPAAMQANGSVRYAADGWLSQQDAMIAPAGSYVTFAEDETGGESFIPHAKSKQRRSKQILVETAKIFGLGVVDQTGKMLRRDGSSVAWDGKTSYFADGAVRSVDEIDAFARGIEGKPYVWGGVNWGDCSGAMSAIARFATGLDAFAGRFATGNMGDALQSMGFSLGRGGDGDLRFGWYNGGPWGGHTSGTLPNGVNVEMGGARGNGQYGGSAAPASDPQYTDHAYLKVGTNYAALNAALQAGSQISGSLGTTYGSGKSGTQQVAAARTSSTSSAPTSWSEVAGVAASAFASGMVSDALDVFGIPDSPPALKAWGMWKDATSPDTQDRTIKWVDSDSITELERDLATKQEELRIDQIKLGEMDEKTKASTRASAELSITKKEQDLEDIRKKLATARVGDTYKVNDDGTLGSKVDEKVAGSNYELQQAALKNVEANLWEAVVGKDPISGVIPKAVTDPLKDIANQWGVPLRFSMGGDVPLIGGPVADAVPALLSAGEHVTRTLVADQARPLLNAMNADPSFARALNSAVMNPQPASGDTAIEYHIHAANADEGIRRAEMMERRRLAAMNI